MTRIRFLKKSILTLSISSIVIFTFSAGGSSTGASDQTATAVLAPVVTGAEISGKVLTVLGENFSSGAKVLINGPHHRSGIANEDRQIQIRRVTPALQLCQFGDSGRAA